MLTELNLYVALLAALTVLTFATRLGISLYKSI
jgi:photosystem I reaction center subunit XII